jgi:hypothetical protein
VIWLMLQTKVDSVSMRERLMVLRRQEVRGPKAGGGKVVLGCASASLTQAPFVVFVVRYLGSQAADDEDYG